MDVAARQVAQHDDASVSKLGSSVVLAVPAITTLSVKTGIIRHRLKVYMFYEDMKSTVSCPPSIHIMCT